MNTVKTVMFRMLVIAILCVFGTQNIAWANPDIFQPVTSAQNLQVQTPFKPAGSLHVHHVFLLKTQIIGIIKHFKGLENVGRRHLFPVMNGIQIDLRFDKKHKDSAHDTLYVIPCSITYKEFHIEYEALLDPGDPEASLVLRRVKKEAIQQRDNESDAQNPCFEMGRGVVNIGGEDVDVREYIKSGKWDITVESPDFARIYFQRLAEAMKKYNTDLDLNYSYTLATEKGLRMIKVEKDLDYDLTYRVQLNQEITMLIAPVKDYPDHFVEVFVWNRDVIGYGFPVEGSDKRMSLSFQIFPEYRKGQAGFNRKQLYLDRLSVLYHAFDKPSRFMVHSSQLGFSDSTRSSNAPMFYLKMGFVPLDESTYVLAERLSAKDALEESDMESLSVSVGNAPVEMRYMVLDIERDSAEQSPEPAPDVIADDEVWQEGPSNIVSETKAKYLKDLRDESELAQTTIDIVLSYMLSGKKLVLAFDRGIGAFQRHAPIKIIKKLKKLKKDPRFESLLSNLVVIEEAAQRIEQKISAYTGDENTDIFMFVREQERKYCKNVEKIHHVNTVYIDENMFGLKAYYPILEIITITLVSYLNGPDSVMEDLKTLGISLDELNIKSIDYESSKTTIFTLLPSAKEFGRQELTQKYARLKRFLEAA